MWQSVGVESAECWPGGRLLPYHGGAADVGFLPLMQRRRLSPLAKAVCAVAWDCWHEAGEMPVVLHSNHGESAYFFEILEDLAAGESVSPSRFSLSVHNAIGGLFSLQTGSQLPYLSLAGGNDDLYAAFIEAGGLLLQESKVLVVCYEQALPAAYQPYHPTPPTTWALAMVLARADDSRPRLRLTRQPSVEAPAAEPSKWTWTLPGAVAAGRLSGCSHLRRSVWHWCLDVA